MVRTQIQLTDDQARILRAIVARERISLAEAVRRCVSKGVAELWPAREDAWSRARGVIGAFQDPQQPTDLSLEHDRYLDEAAR
jgi:hypothetical protein